DDVCSGRPETRARRRGPGHLIEGGKPFLNPRSAGGDEHDDRCVLLGPGRDCTDDLLAGDHTERAPEEAKVEDNEDNRASADASASGDDRLVQPGAYPHLPHPFPTGPVT